jgi:hypothetical protein
MKGYEVGDKVVCIAKKEEWLGVRAGTILPEFQKVYTIREAEYLLAAEDFKEYLYLRFEEFSNEKRRIEEKNFPEEFRDKFDTIEESSFIYWSFKPLEKKETSIETFKTILNKTPHGELV